MVQDECKIGLSLEAIDMAEVLALGINPSGSGERCGRWAQLLKGKLALKQWEDERYDCELVWVNTRVTVLVS